MKGALKITTHAAEARPLRKSQQKLIWDLFMGGGTSHSALAQTLPYVMQRCEEEGIPYRLTAQPGAGYYIEPIKDLPEQC